MIALVLPDVVMIMIGRSFQVDLFNQNCPETYNLTEKSVISAMVLTGTII